MTNGDTQGVAQYFLKYHTDLNVRIRVLKVLPGADKNPPNFMTLLNHAAPLNLKEIIRNDTHTLTHRDIHTLTIASLTHTCHCH